MDHTGAHSVPRRLPFSAIPALALTPVVVPILTQYLVNHPDRILVDFVLRGFTFGFDIGFRGIGLPSRPRNLRSALENPAAVTRALIKELRRGHTAGPFFSPPFACLHCSPLGSAPKKDGAVRLILDLSSPRGCTVNEDISRDEYSIVYSSFDEAVLMVSRLGTRAYMGKIDIRHAFRLCPVRLDQIHLLGFRWLGRFFVDLRLPFGSRSSPYIFSQFADLLAWILTHVVGIAFLLHYLDDFFLAADSEDNCASAMSAMLSFCRAAGIPIAQDKTAGPSSQIVYLGIEIDAAQQVIRLPGSKLAEIKALVAIWTVKHKCTKRKLLSLIGLLSFAAKVVQPGRIFLRRLIDLSTTVSELSHHIVINSSARGDIWWWHHFLDKWNGKRFFCIEQVTSTDLSLASDASSFGIGAVCGTAWLSAPLPQAVAQLHINILELFAVFVAVATWGRQWVNKRVLFFSDNMCVVQVASAGTCKDRLMMRILRAMFFFTAQHNIILSFRHLPGSSNVNADLLSRLQVQRFLQLSPFADRVPSAIPSSAWKVFEDDDVSF